MPASRISLHASLLGPEEREALLAAFDDGTLAGGGRFLERAEEKLRARLGAAHVLAATSCSHALEAAFMALGIGRDDEVILPAYTHPSAANAALRQGARVVFGDCYADGPHLDPSHAETLITPRTRAIVAVHYGGVSRGTRALRSLCETHELALVEDAAQALGALDGEDACGTLGAVGCISFHGTKDLGCGEGGCALTEDAELAGRMAMIREGGTDRARYRAGEVARYEWQTVGSSFLPSELLMALLGAQLERLDDVLAHQRAGFARYLEAFDDVEERAGVLLPRVPESCTPSGHVFHLVFRDRPQRDAALTYLDERGIQAASHFEPLDHAPFGRRLAASSDRPAADSELPGTRRIAAGLLRLPQHPRLGPDQQGRVIDAVRSFLAL